MEMKTYWSIRFQFTVYGIFFIVLGCLTSTASAAQGVGALEEIIVTAQKREESIQKVPVSITSFIGKDIEKYRFRTARDLAEFTPSLRIQGANPNSHPNFFLRGIGSQSQSASEQTSVGIYVDEVNVNARAGQLSQMFDLERVEVLRGPQGTLYGRNTTGGAINLISRKPDGERDVRAMATYGRFDQVSVEGAVGLPITERLSVRVAGVYNKRDGYTKNTFLPGDSDDGDNINNWAVRGQVRFQPTETIDLLLNIHGSGNKSTGWFEHLAGRFHPGTQPPMPPGVIGVPPGFPLGNACAGCENVVGSVSSGDFWTTENDQIGNLNDIDTFGSWFRATIDFDDFTLTSISAYEKVDSLNVSNADAMGIDLIHIDFGEFSEQFSQELRLTSTTDNVLQWIVGLYYFADDTKNDTNFNFNNGFGTSAVFGGALTPVHQYWTQGGESYAVFGDTTYDFNERWTGTFGVRWTKDKKDFDAVNTLNPVVLPFSIPLFTFQDEESWDAFSYRAGLNWQVTDKALIYASYNHGFKSGAYNGVALFDVNELTVVNPEFVDAFEVGAKTIWFDNRVTLNGAIFYNDFEDLQQNRIVSLPGAPGPVLTLQNAASAEVFGAELEAQIFPTDRLRGIFGLSFLDSEYTDFELAEGISAAGNKMIGAPDISFNGMVEYDIVLGEYGLIVPRFEFTYTDNIFLDPTNRPDLQVNDYWLLNTSVAWISADGHWEVRVWGKNITNEEIIRDIFNFAPLGQNMEYHAEPATYGVTVRYQ